MRFVSIASGSSGNCTYIGTDHTHLLVDAGISCKRIDTGVQELGIKPDELAGVLITHEHSDHISGIRVFSKKHHVPLYGTKETLEAIERMDVKKEIDPDLYRPVRADEQIVVGDFTVTPFSNSHDAANPVGYRAEADILVCTASIQLIICLVWMQFCLKQIMMCICLRQVRIHFH